MLGHRGAGKRGGTAARRKSGDILSEILDEKRHPGERPCQLVVHAFACLRLHRSYDSVECRIDGLGLAGGGVEQLGGRYLTGLHEFGETECIETLVFIEAHADAAYPRAEICQPLGLDISVFSRNYE